MKITHIIFLILFLNVHSVQSQDVDLLSLKNWQLKGLGQNAEKIGDTYSAIDYYKAYVKRNPKDEKINYKLAQLYFKVHDFKNAKTIYSHLIVDLKSKKYSKVFLFYAQTLKSLGEYQAALTMFTRYEKETKNLKNNKLEVMALKNEKLGCSTALNPKDTIKTIIFHLDTTINKAGIEFSPIIVSDSVFVYGSSNMESINYYSFENKKTAAIRKFLLAKRNKDSTWIVNENPPAPFFNFEDASTGNGCFSLDKKRFYFTRCVENWKFKTICHIYVSEFANGAWQKPVALGKQINLKNFSSTQPTIGNCYNNILEVLYFSSDRHGGLGGYDIWFSVYNIKSKKYFEPHAINALNTIGNEMCPHYDIETKTLYFSSDGLPGYGGYDIFKCNGELATWTKPENLGYPVNSSFDDLYFTINANQKNGFFTSNRTGSIPLKNENCCDDLFYFQNLTQVLILVHGKIIQKNITDELTHNNKNINQTAVLDSAMLTLKLIENQINPIVIKTDVTDSKGEFQFNVLKDKTYNIIISDKRAIDSVITFNTYNLKSNNLQLDSIQIKTTSDKPVVLNNILYEFDKSDLTSETKTYLDTALVVFLNKYHNIQVEIHSFTDSIGTDDYNMKLSQNRAINVVNYLINKGIKKNRITAIGYGSKNPVAHNTNSDGSDNPEGRKLNRRTEFVIKGKY